MNLGYLLFSVKLSSPTPAVRVEGAKEQSGPMSR